MINHMISESRKLSQKVENFRHDWVGKVIHWESCKKLNFEHTNKLYEHKTESFSVNAMHKILWDFEKETDHLIPARRPDLIKINE